MWRPLSYKQAGEGLRGWGRRRRLSSGGVAKRVTKRVPAVLEKSRCRARPRIHRSREHGVEPVTQSLGDEANRAPRRRKRLAESFVPSHLYVYNLMNAGSALSALLRSAEQQAQQVRHVELELAAMREIVAGLQSSFEEKLSAIADGAALQQVWVPFRLKRSESVEDAI